jgi:hypothetical protein
VNRRAKRTDISHRSTFLRGYFSRALRGSKQVVEPPPAAAAEPPTLAAAADPLPKTASPLPLIGLIGLLMVGAGFAVSAYSKRAMLRR